MKWMSSLLVTLSMVSTGSAVYAKGSGSLEIKMMPQQNTSPAPVAPAPPQDQYFTYNFGMISVGATQPADFYLMNNGNGVMNVKQIDISGVSYWATADCPEILNPGERCIAQVQFRPVTRGFFSGRLVFETNGGNVYVDLSGWAR